VSGFVFLHCSDAIFEFRQPYCLSTSYFLVTFDPVSLNARRHFADIECAFSFFLFRARRFENSENPPLPVLHCIFVLV